LKFDLAAMFLSAS